MPQGLQSPQRRRISLASPHLFDPTSTYPEFPNNSAKGTEEEKQTQGREKDREHEDEPR
jgi:hypothetical protein